MSAVNALVAQRSLLGQGQTVSNLPDFSLPSLSSLRPPTGYQTVAEIIPFNHGKTVGSLLTQLSNPSSSENGNLAKNINAENDAQRSSPSFPPPFSLAMEGTPTLTTEPTPPPWQGPNSACPSHSIFPGLSPVLGSLVRKNENHSILSHHDYSYPTPPSSLKAISPPNSLPPGIPSYSHSSDDDPHLIPTPSSFQSQIPGRITSNKYLPIPPNTKHEYNLHKPEDQHHRHQEQQNTNDRPFKCDRCPQSFNRNHDRKRHKRIHLAVKPFPCSHCDKSFSRKDALKVAPHPASSEDYHCTDH